MISVQESHIRLDARGVAWIDDTNIKVIEVVLDHTTEGLGPEEIFRSHNGYLSLAQIHGALAFYFDNKAAIDAEIDRQVSEVERLQKESPESPIRRKLREVGSSTGWPA